MSLQNDKRGSKALEPELISDPIKKAEAEARNGLRQYPVALVFFGSIGNRYGRKAMAWVTAERQAAQMIKRKRRQHELN